MAYHVSNLVLRGPTSIRVHGGSSTEITKMEEIRASQMLEVWSESLFSLLFVTHNFPKWKD